MASDQDFNPGEVHSKMKIKTEDPLCDKPLAAGAAAAAVAAAGAGADHDNDPLDMNQQHHYSSSTDEENLRRAVNAQDLKVVLKDVALKPDVDLFEKREKEEEEEEEKVDVADDDAERPAANVVGKRIGFGRKRKAATLQRQWFEEEANDDDANYFYAPGVDDFYSDEEDRRQVRGKKPGVGKKKKLAINVKHERFDEEEEDYIGYSPTPVKKAKTANSKNTNMKLNKKGQWKKVKAKKSSSPSVQALLRLLWSQEKTKDMTIQAKDNLEYKCHTALFSAVSNFANFLLRSSRQDAAAADGMTHLLVPDIPGPTVAKFVRKMYCVDTDDDNIAEEMEGTDKISDDIVELFGLSNAKRKFVLDQRLRQEEASWEVKNEWGEHDADYHWGLPPPDNITLMRDHQIFRASAKECVDDYRRDEDDFLAAGDSPDEDASLKKTATAAEKNAERSKKLCTLCGKVFVTATMLRFHMNWHNGLTPYECDKCDFKSHSKANLTKHRKMLHLEPEDKCPHCPEPNSDKHQKLHHDPKLPSACGQCGYRAMSDVTVRNHAAKYHREEGKGNDKLQCDKCPALVSVALMSTHLKKFHDENLPFGCDECGVRCITENQLRVHKNTKHSKKVRIPCVNECGSTFTDAGYMQFHARRHCPKSAEGIKDAMIEREKKLGIADRQKMAAMRTKNKFKRLYGQQQAGGAAVPSAPTEEEEKSFKCSQCDFKAYTEAGMTRHFQSRHVPKTKTNVQQERQCPKCPAKLSSYHYETHQIVHHDPALPYGCDECEYRAVTEYAIKHHKGTYHSKKERIPCPAGCGKQFTDRYYARWHAKRFCNLSTVKTDLVQKEVDSGQRERREEKVKKRRNKYADLIEEKTGVRPSVYSSIKDVTDTTNTTNSIYQTEI